MTLNEFFGAAYAWGEAHAQPLALAAVLLPVVGTVAAWIGRGGKTDADGRVIASAIIGFAVLVGVAEVVAIAIGVGVMDRSVLDANVLLLVSPLVCVAASVAGIRLVFPLSQLGSVRTLADLGAFALACAAVVWFFSRFRGWGIVFFGGFFQLVVIAMLAFFLMRRLYRRAFGLGRQP